MIDTDISYGPSVGELAVGAANSLRSRGFKINSIYLRKWSIDGKAPTTTITFDDAGAVTSIETSSEQPKR